MGIFNYIDTFFFISLGITFVLILLLVFHFKQQIVSLEHKNDTMFEIINNIVKEITYIKSAIFSQPNFHMNDHDEIINLSANPIQDKQVIENKIVISDDDSIVVDSDDEDSDEDNNSNDDNDDSDSDEESDNADDNDDQQSDENDSDDDVDSISDKKEITNEADNVKVINIEFGDNIEVSDTIAELYEDINETELNNNDEINDAIMTQTDDIIVEKLDIQENHLENSNVVEPQTQSENIKEVYRKMTLIHLKALVISKGLVSDSSKMRKPELLRLLESNIDENK
jgi:uncharacterized UPF0146 family protein